MLAKYEKTYQLLIACDIMFTSIANRREINVVRNVLVIRIGIDAFWTFQCVNLSNELRMIFCLFV